MYKTRQYYPAIPSNLAVFIYSGSMLNATEKNNVVARWLTDHICPRGVEFAPLGSRPASFTNVCLVIAPSFLFDHCALFCFCLDLCFLQSNCR